MRRSLVVLMTIVLGVLLGVPATAGASTPYCGITWGSLPKEAGPGSTDELYGIRTGRHDCFDRMVLDVDGDVHGYSVRYVDEIRKDGSGELVPVRGGARLQVIAKVPTIAALSYKKSVGQPFIYPRNDLGYAANFMHMMFAVPAENYEVDPEIEKVVNLLLILHADHEQNCSTSTVRLVGSAQANLFASIAAGICALWGPLHGGANQEVVEMLEQIRADGGDVLTVVGAVADVDRQRIQGRDPGRKDRGRHDRQEERGRRQPPLEAPETPEPPLPGRHRRRRPRGRGRLGRQAGLGDRRLHDATRMRGSISATIRSTARFTTTMISASRTTAHWATGKSWLRMASIVSEATPGQAKTVSVTTAPPRSWPNWRPRMVITGMQAFRKACLTTTSHSRTPFARAVRM